MMTQEETQEKTQAPVTSAVEGTKKARWYVLHVYSGFEPKVKESIIDAAERDGLEQMFEDFQIPTQSVTQVKRGKRVQTERKCMPGYMLIKMAMTDASWHLVKSRPKVVDFLLNNGKPQPIGESEAQQMAGIVAGAPQPADQRVIFEVGQQVCVTDGPFASFNGQVEEVDTARERIKVSVSIFGRATPVELEYTQAEKL